MAKTKSKSAKSGQKGPVPVKVNKEMSSGQREELLNTLQARFEKHMQRHEGIEWASIQARLEESAGKLASLYAMEDTGGEPDVIGYDAEADEYIFCDCSAESPERRSICYDRDGQDSREKKGIYPAGNAVDLAAEMGIALLTEEQYRNLQQLGEFDTKTSSWIETPEDIRERGGALFGDRRYDHVFIYHNGAQSFYGARGFRGALRV
jgi:hypothetical protein